MHNFFCKSPPVQLVKRGKPCKSYYCGECDQTLVSAPVFKRHLKEHKHKRHKSRQQDEYVEDNTVEPKVEQESQGAQEPENQEPLDCIHDHLIHHYKSAHPQMSTTDVKLFGWQNE